MNIIVIATRNAHKVEEIQAILSPRVRCCGLGQWWDQVPAVVEDQPTFEGNAGKKAHTIAEWLRATPQLLASLSKDGLIGVLADDSGLEVDVLAGAPGVHSARFAASDAGGGASNSPDQANNAKLLRLLAGIPHARRTARFRCVLAWLPLGGNQPIPSPLFFQGRCGGRIAEHPTGTGGFGYDPLFIPDGEACSFAELGADRKNQMSHRSQALAAFRAYLGVEGPRAGS